MCCLACEDCCVDANLVNVSDVRNSHCGCISDSERLARGGRKGASAHTHRWPLCTGPEPALGGCSAHGPAFFCSWLRPRRKWFEELDSSCSVKLQEKHTAGLWGMVGGGTVGSKKEGSEAGGSQQSAERHCLCPGVCFLVLYPHAHSSLRPPGDLPSAAVAWPPCPQVYWHSVPTYSGKPWSSYGGLCAAARPARLSLRCVPGRQVTLSAYLSVH